MTGLIISKNIMAVCVSEFCLWDCLFPVLMDQGSCVEYSAATGNLPEEVVASVAGE